EPTQIEAILKQDPSGKTQTQVAVGGNPGPVEGTTADKNQKKNAKKKPANSKKTDNKKTVSQPNP
ncbi:MAG TPA: hypothetical protein VE398_04545, partial [Acidobacteriota bacterium]|nr:hypothetical protein [Acidobacteriota bacterium]